MPSYVAFLRAINVGKRQVKMAAAREWLTDAGFADVDTYIQTGNIRVSSPKRSTSTVSRAMEEVFAGRCGFDVPCFVYTTDELRQVLDDARAFPPPPYADRDDCRRFVTFFRDPLTDEAVSAVADYATDNERGLVVGRAAHTWIAGGYSDAAIFGKLKKVFEPGTARTLKVVETCVDKWC